MSSKYVKLPRIRADVRRFSVGVGLAGLLLGGGFLGVSLPSDVGAAHELGAKHRAESVAGLAALRRTVESDWPSGKDGWPVSKTASGQAAAQIGFSVAISGKTAVVAAPGTAHNAGAAYIYEQTAAKWRRAAVLPDPRGAPNDWFAFAVAISSSKAGTYVAVGGNDTNKKRDFIYVYTGAGKKWHIQAKIGDPGLSYKDMFGNGMTISSSTLVVAAGCWNNSEGEIWIYEHFGQKWDLVRNIKSPQGGPYNFFGDTMSVSGNTLLVGANDSAYVFTRKPKRGWLLTAMINNPGAYDDNFGYAVSLSGTTAIIGAPGGHNGGALLPGAAYVYTFTSGSWFLLAKLTAPKNAGGDGFGDSVSATGTRLLVGMPVYGQVNCGTAFVFAPSGNKWVEKEQIKNRSCTAGDQFGQSVASTSTTGVLGAPGTNNSQGAAYFRYIP